MNAYEINHMWTADMKSNEEWSSQLWSQFLQLRKEAWKKKIQDFNKALYCIDHQHGYLNLSHGLKMKNFETFRRHFPNYTTRSFLMFCV